MKYSGPGSVLRALGMTAFLSTQLFVAAQAADHAGDIEVGMAAGALVVDPEGLAQIAANGYRLFEADFRDFSGGLFKTDDPGFVSEEGALDVGLVVGYRGLGVLQSWNGSMWTSSGPSVFVSIEDVLGTITSFGYGAVTDPAGAIAQVSGAGDIHSHLDFSIGGADRALAGAYLITLQLEANGVLASSPFYIAFNNGLEEAAFEGAVGALMAPVPEPATWAMLIAGVGLVGALGRRRQCV
ncbi:MAG: PEPxxWA-CTERM sorting domain-containing protein [Pseudomonadota bacterium]